jgi:hypothetical protein
VGHLIPDEKYHPGLEGKGASHEDVVAASGIPAGELWFVRELQELHDNALNNHGIDTWKREMRVRALEYGVDPSVLD